MEGSWCAGCEENKVEAAPFLWCLLREGKNEETKGRALRPTKRGVFSGRNSEEEIGGRDEPDHKPRTMKAPGRGTDCER